MTPLVLPERLRLRFAKLGRVRFTSQRDLARVMERAMRRAALPLAHSAGFSPRPLVSFGLALPTGCASRAEYLDLRLDASRRGAAVAVVALEAADPPALTELAARLSALLPDGIDVTAAAGLHGAEPSLQEAVASCDWELEVLGVSPAVLAGRVGRLLDADAVRVARERKGKISTDDIRPAIRELSVLGPRREVDGLGEVVALAASLSTHPRGVRPAELCGVLGDDVVLLGATRTHQWIENDDRTARAEPLTEDGTVCGGLPARTEVQGG
ncbi:MAG TPA: TIGR03936 family radical SAM-associated protein [Acidimicrobiales bacterium]|nr:TIGR03936 family radical SAM-associated protein [Acidimicrobiales bacterium]